MEAALARLVDQVQTARAAKGRLRIVGGDTKHFYGNPASGELLDVKPLAGISSYEPSELVVTVRGGTLLEELEAALAEKGQHLAFEPPRYVARGTVGGMVAAGLAGPARVSAGGVRDHVLGATLLNGRGDVLSFGGQVMKNVAGYDVSRLLAGSLGTLGLIAEASVKVLPRPSCERTLRLEADESDALAKMNRWAGQPLPVSATAWHDGRLFVRLSGAEPAVHAAAHRIGGEPVADAPWQQIREQSHPFFTAPGSLWRVSMPSTARLDFPASKLIEWGGALRWLKTDAPPETVRRAATQATLFRAADKSAGAFAQLDAVNARLHKALKAAFDPAGIFNPGRMYADF
jgi:glycolate oxidase FAD binding subunit